MNYLTIAELKALAGVKETATIVREVLAACEQLHARGSKRGCFPRLDIDVATATAACGQLRGVGVRAMLDTSTGHLWFELTGL